jgi:hypothetical protein
MNPTSRSWRRWITAGGCDLAEDKYTQSGGQLISTNRFVAQQTVQIVCPSAGHDRFGLRSRQTGQFCFSIVATSLRFLTESVGNHQLCLFHENSRIQGFIVLVRTIGPAPTQLSSPGRGCPYIPDCRW